MSNLKLPKFWTVFVQTFFVLIIFIGTCAAQTKISQLPTTSAVHLGDYLQILNYNFDTLHKITAGDFLIGLNIDTIPVIKYTPDSATAPAVTGQMFFDTTYFYIRVDSLHWKRLPLNFY